MKKRLGEVRDLASPEISSKVTELKLELARERSINASGAKPENPGKIRKVRRKIAQMLTIMSEKTRKKGMQEKSMVKKHEVSA
ncbi:MAG: 50S ribosomal protein L29 [Candidatus Diapherotrites archaeon]|nr:50S ribosomal protein L29 [Candidatus Diapherotrites archaeon]